VLPFTLLLYFSGTILSWGAEVANLADLVEPVVRLIEDVSITGAHMAQVMYNATSTAVGTGAGPGNGSPWMVHHKCVFEDKIRMTS
jgi:hypothetical protein